MTFPSRAHCVAQAGCWPDSRCDVRRRIPEGTLRTKLELEVGADRVQELSANVPRA